MKRFCFMAGFLLIVQNVWAQDGGDLRFRYKVGEGLQIATGDGANQLSLQGRVQSRFTYNALENAADNDTFAIQRGRIKMDGHLLDREFLFGFQTNFTTNNTATTGLATLLDYFLDWVPSSYLGIKVGQYKVPFLIQELTSSGKQQFVDRALSTGFFNLARDLGATLHGHFSKGGLSYALFAMNGDGLNTLNRNQGLMTGLRLDLPILGNYKYSETDVDHAEEPNLGVGVAYAFNEAGSAFQNNTIPARTKTSHGTFDLGYKHKGFSFQGASMVSKTHEGRRFTNIGYNGQIGYFLVPKKFEVATKAGGTFFETMTNQFEYALGLNYFRMGHGLKLQTDYTLLMNNRGRNVNDHRFRTQLQVIF